MKPNPTCAYCQKADATHRDHVVPRSRGGPDNATNIVMACQSCNSSKGDRLPSEWMAERCPPDVLLIEARVNAKLKKVFARRDDKQATPLFAFSVNSDGRVQYVGEVMSEATGMIRLATVNALLLWGGVWDLTAELVDVPRADCRLFRTVEACVEAADRTMGRERDWPD